MFFIDVIAAGGGQVVGEAAGSYSIVFFLSRFLSWFFFTDFYRVFSLRVSIMFFLYGFLLWFFFTDFYRGFSLRIPVVFSYLRNSIVFFFSLRTMVDFCLVFY